MRESRQALLARVGPRQRTDAEARHLPMLRIRAGKASTITGVIVRLAAEAARAQQPQPDDGPTERTEPSLGTRCRGQVVGFVANLHLKPFGVCSSSMTHEMNRGSITMPVSFKAAHFPPDIMLMGVRWSIAYPLSTRHVEELMRERGVSVDHSTINRWVIKYSPQLEEAFHRRKRPVWVSWRMDETYRKVKGEWRYLYRAVDKQGQTIDFLLTEQRDQEAA